MEKGRKRKKEEIDVYVEEVNAKVIDGEYEPKDLCANHKNKEKMRNCLEKETFELKSLLHNGKPTGFAQCTSSKCKTRMWTKSKKCIFQVQPDKRSGSKWQLVERHLDQFHLSSENKAHKKGESSDTARQSKMDAFVPGKKLPPSVIEEMRRHNIDVVAQRHTSLNFFYKDEVRNRDRTLLKAGGFNPDEVLKFDRSAPTVKKDLERKATADKEMIRCAGSKLAKEGRLVLAFDHHEIKNLKNQKLIGVNLSDGTTANAKRPTSALGVLLILCAHDGQRYAYLLNYCAVVDKSNQLTVRWAREILQEYGLLASVNKGLIPIIADGGMRGFADQLNPNGFNETCSWHSFQRLGYRAHRDCLKILDPAQSDKLDAILDFCDTADKDLSKKDMKKKKMRTNQARGINSYIDGLELDDKMRLRICQFTRPKGWLSKFEDEDAQLTCEEKTIKQKLMDTRKTMPKIKVYIFAFDMLGY